MINRLNREERPALTEVLPVPTPLPRKKARPSAITQASAQLVQPAEARLRSKLTHPQARAGQRVGQPEQPAPVDDNMTIYLRDISQVPILPPEEQIRLALAYQAGEEARKQLTTTTGTTPEEQSEIQAKIVAGEEAKRNLVETNQRMVISIATKYPQSGVSTEDLVQQGSIGLMVAVEKFNPARGTKFTTYAHNWVCQQILEYIATQSRTINPSRDAFWLSFKIAPAQDYLRETLGRDPNINELAAHLNTTVSKIQNALAAPKPPISLEDPIKKNGSEGDSLIADFIEDPTENTSDTTVEKVMQADVITLLRTLKRRDRLIIQYKFGMGDVKPLTFAEIGELLGVSRQAIEQRYNRVMTKLKKNVDPSLREYLD